VFQKLVGEKKRKWAGEAVGRLFVSAGVVCGRLSLPQPAAIEPMHSSVARAAGRAVDRRGLKYSSRGSSSR
jgi:hypothetical protein